MQRHRHADQRLGRIDRLGGGVGGRELVEVLEQQLGHLVGGLVGDAVMGDQEIADRGGGDVLGLALIGAGRNDDGDIGLADLGDRVGRHGDDV